MRQTKLLKKVKRATINSTHEIELSNYAKIKELKELLDIGAISDEEFQTEKKKLLG
ncbi:SHOCT domain-containing protein [Geomicrobium sp. JCM 19055]|uniref:SHOCT domain-containing protein n=1 Tax=Geomicrobium sp. JCM 19055 TaxID=1460649 RepID=UPI00045ED535|nr:SHOCT domain-containing protein [Geomicrobium sp. JCM 19055]GAJ99394.1 hypothetical protein JCM19055_2392 [Geomicrobium sp. JCM 19055]